MVSLQQAPFLVALDTCIIDLEKSPTRAASERETMSFWLKDIVYPGGKRQQWELVHSPAYAGSDPSPWKVPPMCKMALLTSVYVIYIVPQRDHRGSSRR